MSNSAHQTVDQDGLAPNEDEHAGKLLVSFSMFFFLSSCTPPTLLLCGRELGAGAGPGSRGGRF
jgi:hypothetical protein